MLICGHGDGGDDQLDALDGVDPHDGPDRNGAAVGAAGRPFHAGQADRAGLMQIVDGLRDDGLAADVPGGVRADGARPQVLFHERAQRGQQHDRHGKEQRDLQP